MSRSSRRRFFRRRSDLSTEFVPGNHVELLVDGAAFFPALLSAIERAESYVFMETYILASDQTGERIASALVERARAGVEVALMFDSFGSLGVIEPEICERLESAGAKVHEFVPISPFNLRTAFRRRNHRKSVIIDGHIGIVGGLNLSNDYAAKADGGNGWRDTAVLIRGPAVSQLEQFFRTTWRRARRDPLRSIPRSAARPSSTPGEFEVRFDTNEGRRERANVRRAYLTQIMDAKSTIRLTHAYFTPDFAIRRALLRAAKRGVSVELITARATDVPASFYVARGTYSALLTSGVRIFEWHERVLHAKTAVVDGRWVAIGSANLNIRSLRHDLEVNAFIRAERFGAVMDRQFADDRARSEEITLAAHRSRPIWQRALEWFFGLFRSYF